MTINTDGWRYIQVYYAGKLMYSGEQAPLPKTIPEWKDAHLERGNHFYQGSWHTDLEWREHLLEQDKDFSLQSSSPVIDAEVEEQLGRIIWIDGDRITDGHQDYDTVAEALEASPRPDSKDIDIIIDGSGARWANA